MPDTKDLILPKVLIIDDDESMRKLLARHISKLDCEIILSNTGQKALDFLREEEVALILTDYKMPQMNGLEILSHVKKSSRHRYTPVIFISSLVEEKDLQLESYKTGAVDFIHKPYQPFILRSKVQVFLEIYNKHKEVERLLDEQRKLNQKLVNVTAELNEKNHELDRISRYDSLTNLPNRRDAQGRLQAEIMRSVRSKKPFSIIMSDIDYFKNFNDTYGHDGGDNVLKAIANLLRENIRSQDFVCRWGGEEFLFLLPETDSFVSKNLAEKLRRKVEQLKLIYNEKVLKITMSFGISEFNRTRTLEEVLRIADDHLYLAKRSGRNTVYA